MPIPDDFEADEDLVAAQGVLRRRPRGVRLLFALDRDRHRGRELRRHLRRPARRARRRQLRDLITEPVAGCRPTCNDTANAEACFAGDMNACDAQFRGGRPTGRPTRSTAACAAGGVEDTTALCVDHLRRHLRFLQYAQSPRATGPHALLLRPAW